MTGPRFCALAPLLGAYSGALAARIAQERRETDTSPSPVVSVPSPTGQSSAMRLGPRPGWSRVEIGST